MLTYINGITEHIYYIYYVLFFRTQYAWVNVSDTTIHTDCNMRFCYEDERMEVSCMHFQTR